MALDVRAKLVAVVEQGDRVLATERTNEGGGRFVDDVLSREWATNARALIRSLYGEESDHYQSALHFSQLVDQTYWAKRLYGVVRSALASWDAGYVFDFKREIESAVEGDLIGQAKTLVEGAYLRAAAVVAGAVLEEHLRTIAPAWNVATHYASGKPLTLEPLNIELCKAGAYDGIMQKRITFLGGLRNDAAHGGLFSQPREDVERMIHDVTDVCDRVRRK